MTTLPKPSLPTLPPSSSSSAPKRMTLEEFAAMGEGPPYYEFEDGVLIPRNGGPDPMSSPKDRHQRLLALLYVFLYHFVIQNQLGSVSMEVDVYMPDGKLYIPDITFVAANGSARLDPADDKIHGSPELVVEILSENAHRDRVYKRRMYQRNGVGWYWIIDAVSLTLEELQFLPDGSTLANVTDTGEDFLPVLFPGLTLNLAALMGEQTANSTDNADTSNSGILNSDISPTISQENPS